MARISCHRRPMARSTAGAILASPGRARGSASWGARNARFPPTASCTSSIVATIDGGCSTNDAEYRAFLEAARARFVHDIPLRLLAYVLMPNHWHLVVWPATADELADFCIASPAFMRQDSARDATPSGTATSTRGATTRSSSTRPRSISTSFATSRRTRCGPASSTERNTGVGRACAIAIAWPAVDLCLGRSTLPGAELAGSQKSTRGWPHSSQRALTARAWSRKTNAVGARPHHQQ